MIKNVKAVLFDFGGTLDSDGIHWRDRFFSIYRDEGLNITADSFAKAFYASDDNLPARFELKGLNMEETVGLQVGCVLEALNISDKGLKSRVTQRFTEESRSCLQRNRPFLKRLHKKFRLGIVSNFYGNLDSILAGEGLEPFFDVIADSGKVGCIKPDKGIFLHATRALKVKPEEACMIGDSIPRDMRGAENLNMPHAWIAGRRSLDERCCGSAFVLKAVVDLEPLLLKESQAV